MLMLLIYAYMSQKITHHIMCFLDLLFLNRQEHVKNVFPSLPLGTSLQPHQYYTQVQTDANLQTLLLQ